MTGNGSRKQEKMSGVDSRLAIVLTPVSVAFETSGVQAVPKLTREFWIPMGGVSKGWPHHPLARILILIKLPEGDVVVHRGAHVS